MSADVIDTLTEAEQQFVKATLQKLSDDVPLSEEERNFMRGMVESVREVILNTVQKNARQA